MKNQEQTTELTELLENIENWQKSHQKPTMREIEEAVEKELDKLRQKLIEKVAHKGGEELEHPHCPACESKMMRNGKKKRRLKGKGNQAIELEREQWKCHQCGLTIFPPR